jgi:hypothetical protein
MFDINQLETTDTAKFHVKDAKGRPQFDGDKPITITAYGPGSKVAAGAKFAYDSKRSDRTIEKIGGKVESRTEDVDRRERAAYLGQLVASLDFPCTGGATALFANPKLRFLADDFEKWWNDAGNFTADSPSDASSSSDMQPG